MEVKVKTKAKEKKGEKVKEKMKAKVPHMLTLLQKESVAELSSSIASNTKSFLTSFHKALDCT